MKKIITTLLTAVLLLALCGCSKFENTMPEMTAAPTETAVSITESTEAAEIPTEATEAPTEAPTVPETEPEELGTPGVVYNTRSLNVRQAAGVNNALVTKLKNGSKVTVYEIVTVSGAKWARIDEGWVSLEYIKLDDPDAVPVKQNSDHTHQYTSKTVKVTCTTDGATVYTCSCGHTYQEDRVPAPGHKWSQWETTKEPTEKATGSAQRTCSVCKETETKTLPKLIPNHTHSYTLTSTIPATCTSAGVQTYTCSCGDSYTESIPKTQHKYTSKVTKPTCQNGGYTTYKCSLCGDSYIGNQTPVSDHSWGQWKITVQPTTTQTGLKERSCTVCKATQSESIDRLPDQGKPEEKPEPPQGHVHSYGSQTEVAPTCAEDGYYLATCSCGDRKITPSGRPRLGHSYQITSSIPASCTQEGSTTYTCSRCGDTYTETIPEAHTWVSKHQDAVTHKIVYVNCKCGWSSVDDGANSGLNAWYAHNDSRPPEEANLHSYSTSSETIVDVPAKDWQECSQCGAVK